MENQEKFAERIRSEYVSQESTKLDELKKLDRKVKTAPAAAAYALGSVAALILGVGMCLVMGVIGAAVLSPSVLMALGVVIGCAGIALCTANYFIYKALLKSRKKKYGGRILALSDELLGEDK